MVQMRGQFFLIAGVVIISFLVFMFMIMNQYSTPSSTYYSSSDLFLMNNLVDEYLWLIKQQATFNYTNVDAVLIIDRSGTMAGQPLTDAKAAANIFVDLLNDNQDKSALVYFSYPDGCIFSCKARVAQALTFNKSSVKTAINALTSDMYTAMGEGIYYANSEMINHSRTGVAKVEILLSDGNWNKGRNPVNAANEAAANNISIFTIGLGHDANEALMKQIANITKGSYYYAPSSGDLADIYRRIAYEIHNFTADIPPFTSYLYQELDSYGMNVSVGTSVSNVLTGTQTVKVLCSANCSLPSEWDYYTSNVTVHNYNTSSIVFNGCWDLYTSAGANFSSGHSCVNNIPLGINVSYNATLKVNQSSLAEGSKYMATYTASISGKEFMKICNYFSLVSGTTSGKTVNGLLANISVGSEEVYLVGSTNFGITNCDIECLENPASCPFFS
ncbi:VWA domain-containing protein [Candidatus Micrarchaeota archaeon]|nr:VWA domain-containing protein [Candidatus Micrarchaeota archaeon]